MNIPAIISIISLIFTNYGSQDYIGESIIQLEHAIQVAQHQEKSFIRSQVIAGFLHDISHLIIFDQIENIDHHCNNLGAMGHSDNGVTYLKDLGFGDDVVIPIKNHCRSKRYLLTVQPDYKNQLSEASQNTLNFQGGLMTRDEVKEFEKEDYFLESIKLRISADKSNEINKYTPKELESLKQHYLDEIRLYLENISSTKD